MNNSDPTRSNLKLYFKPKTTKKSRNNKQCFLTNAQSNQSKSPTQSKSQKNLYNFAELSHVTKAEIIWCLKFVQQIWSFNSMCDMSKLFQLIFPATTADKFALGKTKYMHAINYGLSPYLFGELLRSRKSCGEVVCFDEVLNKIVQKCQMVNIIWYYDNDINKVASCYFSSSFLGSSSAKDILESCLEFVNKLCIQMIQQISMDQSNVNWSFLRLFQETLDEKDPALKLFSLGSCGLHVISITFAYGHKHSSWEIHKLLRSLYWLFKDTPARRSIFAEVTGETKFPKNFVKFAGQRILVMLKLHQTFGVVL